MAALQTEKALKDRTVDRDTDVLQLLESYRRALSRGDTVALSALWDFPALVVSDSRTRILSSRDDARHFLEALKHSAPSFATVRPEPVDLRWLTDRMGLVEVRWHYLDASGEDVSVDTLTYTLRRGKTGRLRVQGALMHQANALEH